MRTVAALAISLALLTAAPPAAAAAMSVTAGFMIESGDSYCTVSFVDPKTPYLAYTAKHCYQPGYPTTVHLGRQRIGDFIPEISNTTLDLIAIRLNSGIRGTGFVQTGDPVLTSWAPHIGATVCKYGATTQETCGVIQSVDGNQFSVTMTADHGDSGAPIYQRADNNAGPRDGVHLVGTVIAERRSSPGTIVCTSMTAIENFLETTFGPSWQLGH